MRRAAITLAVAVILAACGGRGSGAPTESQRDAGVYQAVLSAVAEHEAPPVAGQSPPVIYAVPGTRDPIPAQVQVEVVKALKESVTLRFADERSEAIDETKDGKPVHEEGLLVTLSPVPPTGTDLQIPVDVYRNVNDQHRLMVSVTQGPTAWTATSVVPAA
jgi:hypothetical protein